MHGQGQVLEITMPRAQNKTAVGSTPPPPPLINCGDFSVFPVCITAPYFTVGTGQLYRQTATVLQYTEQLYRQGKVTAIDDERGGGVPLLP